MRQREKVGGMTHERIDPPLQADEPTMLLAFLQYHRNTLRQKTAGLDARQLDTVLPPSEMTLGGMLKHLALVEDNWFQEVLLGRGLPEPWASADWEDDFDWDWHSARDDDPLTLFSLLEQAQDRSDIAIGETLVAGGLGALSSKPDRQNGELFTLRWILLHMIEEYARHNGHADLIRESIDGSTGE